MPFIIASLPAIGASEESLRSTYGKGVVLISANDVRRILQIRSGRVSGLPTRLQFDVSSRTFRLYRITVSLGDMKRCHIYEAALRKSRGEPDQAEWGTRAYELTWHVDGKRPAIHYWLHAYDGVHTKCEVVFGLHP